MGRGFLSISIIAVLLLGGCAGRGSGDSAFSVSDSDAASRAGDPVETSDITAFCREKADSALSGMTLEQRVGQCFMPSIYASADLPTLRQLRHYIADLHVGGVVLLKGDLRSAARMAGMGAEAEMPLFMAIDAEWGLGMRLEDAPDFPRNGRLGPGADERLLFDYGGEVARECRRVGINMVLGPVVDVVENPRGVIGSRSFGSDPKRVADLGVAYARGVESGRVISVAKHFPGHGSPDADSHKSLPVVRRDAVELDSIDLYPFRNYVDAGLSGVMVGHLAVPAVDSLSLPAAVSPSVIGGLLRRRLGFGGIVLTDALNMEGARGYDASSALSAGADIVVGPENTALEIENVIGKIRRGEMRAEVIDDRCRRILFYKYLMGIDAGKEVSLDGIPEDVREGADSIWRRLVR